MHCLSEVEEKKERRKTRLINILAIARYISIAHAINWTQRGFRYWFELRICQTRESHASSDARASERREASARKRVSGRNATVECGQEAQLDWRSTSMHFCAGYHNKIEPSITNSQSVRSNVITMLLLLFCCSAKTVPLKRFAQRVAETRSLHLFLQQRHIS